MTKMLKWSQWETKTTVVNIPQKPMNKVYRMKEQKSNVRKQKFRDYICDTLS